MRTGQAPETSQRDSSNSGKTGIRLTISSRQGSPETYTNIDTMENPVIIIMLGLIMFGIAVLLDRTEPK